MPLTSRASIETKLTSPNGNDIEAVQSVSGGYHLATTTEQNVYADPNNSSTTNLDAGNSYTFTGTATTTLGVVGLQVSMKTDQNATVYVDQSPDGTNWDIVDNFDYFYSLSNFGVTVQAVNSYVRVRVVLTGTTDTTYFRLQLAMCPMVEALPRALSPDGRLFTETTLTGRENTERHAWINPTLGLNISESVKLIGSTFDGAAKNTNFWTEIVTGTGAVTQGGEVVLSTGITANSTVKYTTVSRARFIPGASNIFLGYMKFITAGTADNVRRVGPYDTTDGFFFQLNGTTFGIVSRKASAPTVVNSGSFNGNLGATYVMDLLYHKLSIEWTPTDTYFFVDDKLLHTLSGGHLSNFLTLPITMENINSNGQIVNVSFDCIAAVVMREGKLEASPRYKYIAGAVTTVCKLGGGILHSIVNNDNVGSVIVYDNTSGAVPIMASIDLTKILGTITFNCPFSTGLTLVSTGAVKITVVYE